MKPKQAQLKFLVSVSAILLLVLILVFAQNNLENSSEASSKMVESLSGIASEENISEISLISDDSGEPIQEEIDKNTSMALPETEKGEAQVNESLIFSRDNLSIEESSSESQTQLEPIAEQNELPSEIEQNISLKISTNGINESKPIDGENIDDPTEQNYADNPLVITVNESISEELNTLIEISNEYLLNHISDNYFRKYIRFKKIVELENSEIPNARYRVDYSLLLAFNDGNEIQKTFNVYLNGEENVVSYFGPKNEYRKLIDKSQVRQDLIDNNLNPSDFKIELAYFEDKYQWKTTSLLTNESQLKSLTREDNE